MSFSHRIMVAVLALLPLAAAAQQAQPANPADANAPVPATGYVSAFKSYLATPEEQASPDTVWRAANEEVAGTPAAHAGHAGMSGMSAPTPGAHAGHADHMAKPQGSAVANTPAPTAAKVDPHAGHGAHHH